MNPPPPTQEEDTRAPRAGNRKVLGWLLAIAVIALLLLFSNPLPPRSHRPAADRTEALNNIKQVGMMLYEFDHEYGRFPDASTAAAVKEATGTELTLGSDSSNELFRQLLAAGSSRSEKVFWAKSALSPKKPDEIFTPPSKALAPGECGFAYIAGLTSTGHPETPVVMTPLIPGKLTFDPKPFKGKAIILRLDNSATTYPIDQHGHVIINGLDLFDPRQPFWHGKAPDIKWPE